MTRLTARQVQTLRKPGRYSDGHGLHLFVQRSGTRSWVQRLTVPGRGRVDRGLGSVDVVSRAWALDNKLAVKRGEDPFAGPQRSTAPTLRKIAGRVADSNRARLSPGEQQARAATLERHAADLLDLPVDRVGKPEVLRALERVWTSQPGTGRKLRTALGAIFRRARAAGLIEVDPVAAVAGALVPQPAVRQHMRSVPYADAPAAMKRIDTCRATLSAKACLRFQILTAARPSEARLATWGEIAADAREWRIPACRMKQGREHVVPLVPAAVALLGSVQSLRRHDGDAALLFPSPQAGAGSLSAATVAGVMKSAGLAGAGSPHGWRSTFRTWASERADADYAVMETRLSHAVGSAVERSYSRSTFLDKRRALLDAWSEFLAGNVAVIAEGGLSLASERVLCEMRTSRLMCICICTTATPSCRSSASHFLELVAAPGRPRQFGKYGAPASGVRGAAHVGAEPDRGGVSALRPVRAAPAAGRLGACAI